MDLDEILKSIREEGNSTGGKIVPAKFLGEDRYEKYAEELAQDGTLDGDRLTIEERKEGVKAYRKGKINFKTFVDKVLVAKKAQSVGRSSRPKSIGSGGGALVVRNKTISADDMRSGSSVETEQNLDEILKGIDSIRETLKKEEELKKKQASDSKKSEERRKRKAKEDKLEGSVFKGLAKQTKKVFAPVKSILDRMIDFFTKILIGRFLVKLIDWMTDEKNQKKLEALGFLLEKTWPALVTAFVLFGTSFGRLIRGILGLALKYTGKLIGAAAKFAIKNPLAAAAVAVVGGAAIGGIMQSQTQSNDAERAAQGKTQLDDTLEFGGATGDPMGALMFNSGGFAPAPKGTDTVPAMLTPGEFVMSKGAVDAFGTDFMESLNSLGGGTNKPKRSNGTLYASSGGSTKEEPGGRNKTESKSSGGFFSSIANFFNQQGITKPKEKKKDDSSKSTSSGGGSTDDKFAKDMIKVHEGLRLDKYMDSRGFPTIGYGHLIEPGESMPDRISKQKADELFDEDYTHHKAAAMKIPGYSKANAMQKAALIDLTFNMGPAWANGFPAFKKAFAAGNYEQAGNELVNSAWYGQVGRRAPTIVNLIKGKGADNVAYLKDVPKPMPGSGQSQIASSSPSRLSPSSTSGGSSISASLSTIRSYLSSTSGSQTARLGKNAPSVSTPTPPVRSQPKVQTINSGSESGQAESPPLLSSDTPFIPSPPASAEKMLVMGLPA